MNKFKEKFCNPLHILNFATFFQYQRFVMPISFLFYLHNGLNFSQFLLCQSIYCMTCLIAKFLFGAIGDIFSKKYVIIFSYLLFMLRVILWINFTGFWIMLAGEILYGLFKALYRGNVDSYIYEYLQTNDSGSEIINKYGKLSSFTSAGSATSCIIGVLLYKWIGFKGILYVELITQIIAVSSLFLLPNLQCIKAKGKFVDNYFKIIFKSILSAVKDSRLNYSIFYAAILSGLTSVFVWNFQPMLKLASAPIFMYGLVSFINQMFRSGGGFFAQKVVSFLNSKIRLFRIEYLAVAFSFLLLYCGHHINNYILVSCFIIIICIAISLFVIFNIFNVSNIQAIVCNSRRASTSSANVFIEDFVSFAFLFTFKSLYDLFKFDGAILIFALISLLILIPNIRRIKLIAQ